VGKLENIPASINGQGNYDYYFEMYFAQLYCCTAGADKFTAVGR
jgi:hypothetical protein